MKKQNKFTKNNYQIYKQGLDKKIAVFVYNYFRLKREVARTFFATKYISPITEEWGVWNDEQVPNTYSHYADIAMETIMLAIHPLVEKETNLKLVPTYSYARLYKKGDILERHRDRFSCEISVTLFLGGNPWDIFLKPMDTKDSPIIRVKQKPGDMLIYSGWTMEHWREPFAGTEHCQVFLHFNKANKKNTNMFDRRPHLGLPGWFKRPKT